LDYLRRLPIRSPPGRRQLEASWSIPRSPKAGLSNNRAKLGISEITGGQVMRKMIARTLADPVRMSAG